ncbi:hypothetical protein [Cognatilysobacter lacus]|uniref:Transmembrane protein n=1 Tax=Cognatilysobacter lacus TaxID=1643323 RepID=A0A5D8Z675_9GAMM|nr:hypothetical protein [Lysobacter lacus]TZF90418.1 hypothetical protein FW784_05290 [Lysobacter lacus]
MPISFREKSQWVVLITVVAVYARYFADVLPGHAANVAPADIARFAAAVFALVAFQVAGQVVLAIAARRELAHGLQHDERDTRIDLRASRIGSHVLAIGVFASLAVALNVPGNFAVMHVLFGALVLSQGVEIATRLALYRRGL